MINFSDCPICKNELTKKYFSDKSEHNNCYICFGCRSFNIRESKPLAKIAIKNSSAVIYINIKNIYWKNSYYLNKTMISNRLSILYDGPLIELDFNNSNVLLDRIHEYMIFL